MKYSVICKVNDNKFVKYRTVTNLQALVRYLDNNFTSWRWVNVFDKSTRSQVGSITRNNKELKKV